jgi:small-conductance mechanosensitive channel
MIIPLIAEAIYNGISFDLDYWKIAKIIGLIAIVVLVKLYCRGATNLAERQLHSKVVIVTVRLPINI